MVKQGDIIEVSFEPSVGDEERKTRPALVISSNSYNKYCKGFAIVCPISHANDFFLNIDLPDEIHTTGKVLCAHLRYFDIEARGYKYIESVPKDYMSYIEKIIRDIL